MEPLTADDLPIHLEGTARRVVSGLCAEFAGVFSTPAVEHLVVSTVLDLSDRLDDSRSLWRQVDEVSRDRLRGLVDGVRAVSAQPHLLFLCTHAAGRSQMAAAWTGALAAGAATAAAAGSVPAASPHPAVVAAMAEVGIDLADVVPQRWDEEMVRSADVVVTMGCGDTCPIVEGPRYVDWDLEDPEGLDLDAVRRLRDEIRARVSSLLESLDIHSSDV